jgi:hypothetical protein
MRAVMAVRTRGLDMRAAFRRAAVDTAARAEAEAVIQRWNDQLGLGRDMLWSPTILAALLAGRPWLDVFCPGCGTSRAIDLRTIDRHPLASVGTLVLGLKLMPKTGARKVGKYPSPRKGSRAGDGQPLQWPAGKLTDDVAISAAHVRAAENERFEERGTQAWGVNCRCTPMPPFLAGGDGVGLRAL